MKIKEIEDKEFNTAVLDSISGKDSQRRWEIHFTDLPYSLILAFYRKIFPEDEDDLSKISIYMRGKGHELGYINLIKDTMYDVRRAKLTSLGCATGSIDFTLDGNIYEITTTLALRKGEVEKEVPFAHKVKQLSYYMASENKNEGRLKVFILIAWRCENCGNVVQQLFPPFFCKRCKKKRQFRLTASEKTWKVVLSDSEVKRIRADVTRRSYLLKMALMTGDWSQLPRTEYEWMKEDEEEVIDWMNRNKRKVKIACIEWKNQMERR